MNNKEYKEQLISKAYSLARSVISLADKFPNKRSAWIITDQLIRAVTSIGANIIEAQAASSKRDFINFLNHALKSANESRFWLNLAKDLDPKLIRDIEKLIIETDELAKILASSIIKLRNK
jgi:four helix bundle protein